MTSLAEGNDNVVEENATTTIVAPNVKKLNVPDKIKVIFTSNWKGTNIEKK